VTPGFARRLALAGAAAAVLVGATGLVLGSTATLTVTPKNAGAFSTCVLTAYPTTSSAALDAVVNEQAKTNSNGALATIPVQSRTTRNTRGFLRFDVAKCTPTIASSATVRTASLRLNLAVAPDVSRTYDIKRVTGPCPEAATTCWSENGLTWNNQPPVAAVATSTLTLGPSSATNQYYAFNVTADVAAMVAGTVSNYGWRVSDTAEAHATGYVAAFKAKDAGSNASGAPVLVIAYSP